jgi:hypothetical protein
MIISWPYDAIHKTHIHFDNETGEMTLGRAPDWEICKILYRVHEKVNKETKYYFFFPFLAGIGCKQQDILLSTFIKQIYAEIERAQQQKNNKNNLSPQQTPVQLEQQQPRAEPSKPPLPPPIERRRYPAKKAMSTPEAITELKKLCKQEDPCTIYTDMVKIGEG